jgi:hypothetical protein
MFLIAALAVGTVVAARGSGPGPLPPAIGGEHAKTAAAGGGGVGGGSAAPPSLPGAQTWSDGVSSYDFGTNDTIDYGTPNVDTLASVQADLKAGGLTLMRVWGFDDMPDATIQQKVAATQNAGMTCMFMLGSTNDLTWMQHIVTMLGSSCHIFEFGNEPDYGSTNPANGSIAVYTHQWDTDIPQLRALDPSAVFGGPTVYSPSASSAAAGNYPSDMAYFLAKSKAAGVLPNFVSYHDYPCDNASTWDKTQALDQEDCYEHISNGGTQHCLTAFGGTGTCPQTSAGVFAVDQRKVLGWETQYLGKEVPTGISEYNFDPGSGTLSAWANDAGFMSYWTTTAIDAFVANNFAFAIQFTSMNYAGYGDLDMFSDASPYEPKAQFYAIAASVKDHGGPSTLTLPNPLP